MISAQHILLGFHIARRPENIYKYKFTTTPIAIDKLIAYSSRAEPVVCYGWTFGWLSIRTTYHRIAPNDHSTSHPHMFNIMKRHTAKPASPHVRVSYPRLYADYVERGFMCANNINYLHQSLIGHGMRVERGHVKVKAVCDGYANIYGII